MEDQLTSSEAISTATSIEQNALRFLNSGPSMVENVAYDCKPAPSTVVKNLANSFNADSVTEDPLPAAMVENTQIDGRLQAVSGYTELKMVLEPQGIFISYTYSQLQVKLKCACA